MTHLFPRAIVEIEVYSIRLVLQPILRLLHIVRHRIIGDESFRFSLIVLLGRIEKGYLEGIEVDVKHLALSIGLVETEGDCSASD